MRLLKPQQDNVVDLQGKDNLSNKDFENKDNKIIIVDSNSDLSRLDNPALSETTKIHFHYLIPMSASKWIFEDAKSLYESLEKSYNAKRKSEYFKWSNFFNFLNKKYGEENYQQKLLEVLTHAQKNPESRTASIIERALYDAYKSEKASINYHEIMQEELQKRFKDYALELLPAHFANKKLFAGLVGFDELKILKLEDLPQSISCGMEKPETDLEKYYLLISFLNAKVDDASAKNMNAGDAREHFAKVINKINKDEFNGWHESYKEHGEGRAKLDKYLQDPFKYEDSTNFDLVLNYALPENVRLNIKSVLDKFQRDVMEFNPATGWSVKLEVAIKYQPHLDVMKRLSKFIVCNQPITTLNKSAGFFGPSNKTFEQVIGEVETLLGGVKQRVSY